MVSVAYFSNIAVISTFYNSLLTPSSFKKNSPPAAIGLQSRRPALKGVVI